MKTPSLVLVSSILTGLLLPIGSAAALESPAVRASFRLIRPVVRCEGTAPKVALRWRTTTPGAFTIQRRTGVKPWQTIGTTRGAVTFTDPLPKGTTGRFSYRILSGTAQSTIMRAAVRPCATSNARSNARSSSTASTRSPLAWGSYVGESPRDLETFETTVGKSMNMVALFVGGEDPFPSEFAASLRSRSKTLVIFWEPHDISLQSIIDGQIDKTLTDFARDAKAYGGPVIFAPFHEMNGDWDSWGGPVGTNTPAQLIAAWRHVHDLFTGAPNVRFGWVVNHLSVPDTLQNRFELYYPGDAYVDIVGVDGFNWGIPWESFDTIFSDSLARLRTYNKQMMIFSMGSAEGPKKAEWITDALRVQLPKHPDVTGWLWFNIDKEHDWRIWSSPQALDAFKKSF